MTRNWCQTPVFFLAACLGCAGPAAQRAEAPRGEPGPGLDGLSLDAAREAHRRAAVRRQLRFLEAQSPGHLLRTTAPFVAEERIEAGLVGVNDLVEVGRLIFEHEYSFADGLGGPGSRRDLDEGRSPFRRVHRGTLGGPETTSCASCHWRGGPGGAGALQDDSFILGDGDHVSSADARNPPALHGAGVVEALAREMTIELEAERDALHSEAREQGRTVERELTAKGVSFGVLRVSPDGAVDAARLDGIDPDLVVKPFGWKGTFDAIRGFITESLGLHMGIEAGAELTQGQLTALTAYVALLDVPAVRYPEVARDLGPPSRNLPAPLERSFHEEWARGRELFDEVGCSVCHKPYLVLKDPVLRMRRPGAASTVDLDLARDGEPPRLEYDAALGGYPVWLFSDLKRHDLGEENAAKHADHGVAPRQYLTRRLWGLGASPPYFHDGRAPWLDQAIAAHKGDAANAASVFGGLSHYDKGALRVFLLSLRRERRLFVPE